MKAITRMVVAGMLAMATALPVAQARIATHISTKVTITDELAYRILTGVTGELEAQLHQSLSTNFLYNEYKAGRVQITYLGYDGVVYTFRVVYGDGVGIESLDEL